MLAALQNLGAEHSMRDPVLSPFSNVASIRSTLENAKREADSRYGAYLRENGRGLPVEANGSGLVLMAWFKSRRQVQDGESGVGWDNIEEIAKECVFSLAVSHLQDAKTYACVTIVAEYLD